MTVQFLASAQTELAEAFAYYDTQREGLGVEFLEEVKRALERIITLKLGHCFLQEPDVAVRIGFHTESFIRSGVKSFW